MARAPAKVNLGLRLTGVRPDGYHLLDSLFVPIDLADRVDVEVDAAPEPAVELALSGPEAGDLPAGADNLVVRAAERFLAATGLSLRVAIELEKHIPSGAGLGGGSSDAAAVLRELARRFPQETAQIDLTALALALGADVPFFLDPTPSRVRGIGEQVEPVAGVPALALLLAHPGISLATAAVYANWDEHDGALTRKPPRPTMPAAFGPGLQASALHELLENDLEPPAVRLCPSIAQLQEQIRSLGAVAVGMSGSGATVFGIFENRSSAEDALDRSQRGKFGPRVWARFAMTGASRE